MRHYLDQAATSFPKPACVAEAMRRYTDEVGATVNRSVYGPAEAAEEETVLLRERLCGLFGFSDPRHVILTAGATMGLNLVLMGALEPGDHVLLSAMEHNAVMRPLTALEDAGVTFDRMPCDSQGYLRLQEIEPLIRPNTKLVVLCHASNVSGALQDAAAVGEICQRHGIPLVLDAAQTAGHVPVSFSVPGLSALVVPAHKGLLGPAGIGAALLTPAFATGLKPLVYGGTGSDSHRETQPRYMPDRFEAGTPNLPGIYGWSAALAFIEQTGVETLLREELALTALFLDGISRIPGARLIGPAGTDRRVGVVSVDFPGLDNGEAAHTLAKDYGVLTRSGLHCAPSAHRTLGTFPRGTVRFSLGWGNTEQDVEAALKAVAAVARTGML